MLATVSDDDGVTYAPKRSRSERIDSVLGIAVWAMLALVIGVGSLFGWTVYQTRIDLRNASPALRALRVLEQSARREPNSAPMRVRLAEAQAAAGLYPDAVKNLKAALKIDPKHTGALLDLGIIALIQGEESPAEKYLLEVVDLTSGSQYEDLDQRREQALYYLGRLAVRQKRYEDAVGYLKGALRIRDDASDTYVGLAEAFKGLGEYDAAVNNAEIALSFDPNYPEGHFLLGEIHLAAGREASAAVELRRAVELDDSVIAFQETLDSLGPAGERLAAAKAALAAGDREAALGEAVVAYALDPGAVEAVKLYAQLLERTGDRKTALAVFKEAAELAPDDAEVKAAVVRLERQSKK